MSVAYNTSVVTAGLRHCFDLSNAKSYTSGTTITDLITQASGSSTIPNSAVSWMNGGVNQITITVVIKRLTGIAGYATNPLTKNATTTDTTFNVYVFGNFGGTVPADDGKLRFYSNLGGTWNATGATYQIAINETVVATLQYNSTSGGQLWVNGARYGIRSAGGIFGSSNNTSNLVVYTPPSSSEIIMYYAAIYDSELTDSQIQQNFYALRGRYGL